MTHLGLSFINAFYLSLTLVAMLALMLAFFYYNWRGGISHYDKDTITSLQNSLAAREEEIKILREQNIKQQTQMSNQAKEIDDLRNNLHTLERLVTAKEDIARLETNLQRFDILLGDTGLLNRFAATNVQLLAGLQEVKQLLVAKV